jgi:hypothetical protein
MGKFRGHPARACRAILRPGSILVVADFRAARDALSPVSMPGQKYCNRWLKIFQ